MLVCILLIAYLPVLQIDEFLQSGTMSVLEEAGGFQKPSATGEGAAKPSGEQAMALKFL